MNICIGNVVKASLDQQRQEQAKSESEASLKGQLSYLEKELAKAHQAMKELGDKHIDHQMDHLEVFSIDIMVI